MRERGLIITLFLVFVGAMATLNYPAVFSWGARIIGHPDSDIWKHLWGDVWFLRSFGESFPVPLSTRLIGFPEGGLLYNLDPITGGLVKLLGTTLGVGVVRNLTLCASIVLGGMGAFLLARRFTGDGAASAVAGAIYGFAAQIQCLALASGIGETVHIAYLPLSLLAILHVLEERSWFAVFWGGIALWLSALGSWYYGLMTGLFALALVLRYGVGAGWISRAGLRPILRASGRLPLSQLALMATFALALTYPFIKSFSLSISHDDALNNIAAQGIERGTKDLLPLYNGAVISLRDLVVPREPRVNLVRDLLIFSNHPGFIGLILGAVAVLRGGALTRLLAITALLSLAVGLGPVIHIDRATALAPNPVFLTLEHLPFFGVMRNLERFQVPFTLCLGVLAAFGARHLLNWLKLDGTRRNILGVVLAALAIVEASWVSGLPMPIPSSPLNMAPIYPALAKVPGRFAIIELPLTDRPGGKQFWHQIAHGRPLPINLEGNLAPSLKDNPLMRQLIAPDSLNFYLQGEPGPIPGALSLEVGRMSLKEQGFRFVVLTQGLDIVNLEEELRLREVLWDTLGPPIKADLTWGYEVYAIDPSDVRAL